MQCVNYVPRDRDGLWRQHWVTRRVGNNNIIIRIRFFSSYCFVTIRGDEDDRCFYRRWNTKYDLNSSLLRTCLYELRPIESNAQFFQNNRNDKSSTEFRFNSTYVKITSNDLYVLKHDSNTKLNLLIMIHCGCSKNYN